MLRRRSTCRSTTVDGESSLYACYGVGFIGEAICRNHYQSSIDSIRFTEEALDPDRCGESSLGEVAVLHQYEAECLQDRMRRIIAQDGPPVRHDKQNVVNALRVRGREIIEMYRECRCIDQEVSDLLLRRVLLEKGHQEHKDISVDGAHPQEDRQTFWQLMHRDEDKFYVRSQEMTPSQSKNPAVADALVATRSRFFDLACHVGAGDASDPGSPTLARTRDRAKAASYPGAINGSRRTRSRSEHSEASSVGGGYLQPPSPKGKQSSTRRLVSHRKRTHDRRMERLDASASAAGAGAAALAACVEEEEEDGENSDGDPLSDAGSDLSPGPLRSGAQRDFGGFLVKSRAARRKKQAAKDASLGKSISLPQLSPNGRGAPSGSGSPKLKRTESEPERLLPLVPLTSAFVMPWRERREHRPNEAASWEAAEEQMLSPTKRYLRVCRTTGVIPSPAVLNMVHSGRIWGCCELVDDHLLAMAAMVRSLDRLDMVDLAGNRMLSNQALVRFLGKLAGKPAMTSLTHLSLRDLRQASKPTVDATIELLSGSRSLIRLQHLDVSRIPLPTSCHVSLCHAIQSHAALRHVNLADTGIGLQQSTVVACIESIIATPMLEELDLSWNCFPEEAFRTLGQGVCAHKRLRKLSLANCTGSAMKGGDLPIVAFLERLMDDRTLRTLDVSMNRIEYDAALVLEEALDRHAAITELDVSNNPLGVEGMRSFMRLLCGKFSGLRYIICDKCMRHTASTVTDEFVYHRTDPSGRYCLDLSRAQHRAVLRLLYRSTNRYGLVPTQTFRNLTFSSSAVAGDKGAAKTGKKDVTKYTHPTPDERGLVVVPSSGHISLLFSLADALVANASGFWPDANSFVKKHYQKVRFSPSFHKVTALLAQFKGLDGSSEQLLLLRALSKDFSLTVAQLQQLMMYCRSVKVVCELLQCVYFVASPSLRYHAFALAKKIKPYMQVRKQCWSILTLNVNNPTGRHSLDLCAPSDFAVAEILLLLDRWASALTKLKDRVDTSFHGNWCNFRNCTHDNTPILCVPEWRVQSGGILLCDYVTWFRIAPGATPCSEKCANDLSAALRKSPCGMAHKARCLRAVSCQLNLRATQLRFLTQSFGNLEQRIQVTTSLYVRLVDPENKKVFHAGLISPEERYELQQRLGCFLLADFLQPEGLSFNFDISVCEERKLASTLVALRNREGSGNIKEPKLTYPNGELFNFERGVPVSWDKEKSLPSEGVFSFSYACSPEDRKFAVRRELARTHGNLVESIEVKDVLWWSQIREAPDAVKLFLFYAISQFPDATKMFLHIDGPGGNGEISRVEVKEALEELKWKEFVRNKDLSVQVFRFLDPDGGGSISIGEWKVIQQLWNDVQLTLFECMNCLNAEFGDISDAYDFLDDDGSDSIELEEWKKVLADVGYFGDGDLIFRFITTSANTKYISRESWKQLETLWDARFEIIQRMMKTGE
eukprot:TRINITY_DN23298_c0_g1_i1.p1 TRINITY_DN23298_c0_g1~~TRINITY_DN23298_c0_g1_i1.p1  ORF type:complete len:1452 (+),score=244.96 TRINITY_DN23298_c0_g1_i1:207-4562(+)